MKATSNIICFFLMIVLMSNSAVSQSGNNTRGITSIEGSVVSLVAKRESGTEPISLRDVFLYENSVE